MKKYFLIALLFPLWGAGRVSAQVTVSNMATDYPASKISFTVTWTAQPHNDQIWVIVDYIKVENASTAGNTWKRALVTAVAKNAGAGSVATVAGLRGFWLNTSGSSGSANITATLSLDAGAQQFNWCAYALNYPPNAELQPDGSYKLTGTLPFTVNGTTLPAGNATFGPGTCITSLTDATDNPAGIIPAPPSIQLSAGSSSLTVPVNTALPALKYTTTNASGATLTAGSFPTGVSGAWASNTYTVSGTPTAAGTFDYTVTTANANGCANASVTGTLTVFTGITYTNCTTPTLTLGAVGFTSSTTYSVNGLTLSSPVTVTWCNTRTYSDFDGGSSDAYKADCAQNYYSTSYGNWFSWCMVVQYASKLCPSPWRVPTRDDQCQIVNGSPSDCSTKAINLIGSYGFAYTGCTEKGQYLQGDTLGCYWSTTETLGTMANYLGLLNGISYIAAAYPKYAGFALNCVR
ncbi:MAG: hypothetical protein LBU42_08485 [Prevotellaceae bacterium]|jgi:hypothetical protein|nr:hypothetical protein [Prevotellaceae bacterium]